MDGILAASCADATKIPGHGRLRGWTLAAGPDT